jgi:hypothetical protein
MNAMTTINPEDEPLWLGARDGKDPTTLSWPPTLPIELALKTATPGEIQLEYGYSDEEWQALPKNPVFMKELAGACEMVRTEGMSFKLKARLIAEENLKETFKMIRESHDLVAPAVKGKLIELTARWAGYDPRTNGEGAVVGSIGNTLAIQINLGKDY